MFSNSHKSRLRNTLPRLHMWCSVSVGLSFCFLSASLLQGIPISFYFIFKPIFLSTQAMTTIHNTNLVLGCFQLPGQRYLRGSDYRSADSSPASVSAQCHGRQSMGLYHVVCQSRQQTGMLYNVLTGNLACLICLLLFLFSTTCSVTAVTCCCDLQQR